MAKIKEINSIKQLRLIKCCSYHSIINDIYFILKTNGDKVRFYCNNCLTGVRFGKFDCSKCKKSRRGIYFRAVGGCICVRCPENERILFINRKKIPRADHG